MMSRKLLPLESLRGIAATSMIFFHLNLGSNFNNKFTENAWLMVDFFFVLSGFVISLNYKNKIHSINDLLNFQKKRFFRLYPLHVIMLIVFVLIEFLRYFVEVQYGLIANRPAFVASDFPAFVANLFLLQTWLIPELSFNVVSWSISVEFYTYAIFGILMIFPRLAKDFYIAVCFLIIFVSGMLLHINSFGTDTITGPARCLYSFFLGTFVHQLYQANRLNFGHSIFAIIGLTLSIIVVMEFGESEANPMLLIVPWVFAISILILVCTSPTTLIYRMLSNHFLVYLGTISYSIYMIHTLFTWITYQMLRFVFDAPTQFHKGVTTVYLNNPFLADIIVCSVVIIVIYCSALTHRYVELPSKSLLKTKFLS